MVDSKRYTPTNERFRKHTQNFVSEKTKKGHLNDKEKDKGDVSKEDGKLIKVYKKLMKKNGWIVKVDGKEYHCSYGDNIVFLPPCTDKGTYYVPKKECLVEVSIDKKSKIYTITRMKDPNKQPIEMMNDSISLQGSGLAELKVEADKTKVSGESLDVEGDVNVDGDVKIDTSKDEDLPDSISLKSLYKEVQILKNNQNSDEDDSGK